jgi:DNA-directed RNA polymerase III subunit RPC3
VPEKRAATAKKGTRSQKSVEDAA